jgi:hypothetical protein
MATAVRNVIAGLTRVGGNVTEHALAREVRGMP